MNAAAVFAVFALLIVSLHPVFADPVKKPASGKTVPEATISTHKLSKGAKPPAKSASTHSAGPGTRQLVVTRKKVNGRWVRVTQVVHSNPAPSYQIHPDPERYQQIQQALANGGYFKGTVDGKWGDDSVAALKQFQTDRNMPNDGKISSLSLIGLGLGPNREAVSAPAPPPVTAPAAAAPPEGH